MLDRIDVVNAEWQNISVIDRVHDGVGVELIAKSLLCGFQIRITAGSGIDRENRCSGKTENVILLEISGNFYYLFTFLNLTADNACVHIAKLTAMALIKYQNDVLISDWMVRIFLNKHIQLLNGRYDNAGSAVLKLLLQNSGTLVSVGSTFFKSVIFFDCLVVQILTVNHEQNFFDIRKACCKLCCLKGS